MTTQNSFDAARQALPGESSRRDYSEGFRAGHEEGFREGQDDGHRAARDETKHAGEITVRWWVVAGALVICSIVGATFYFNLIREKERTARIQSACSGSLDAPGPAVACALAQRGGR